MRPSKFSLESKTSPHNDWYPEEQWSARNTQQGASRSINRSKGLDDDRLYSNYFALSSSLQLWKGLCPYYGTSRSPTAVPEDLLSPYSRV